VGAGVVERGEIDGNISKHEWPVFALFRGFTEDEDERGDFPGEYGEGGGNLEEEVCTCNTKM